MLAFCLFALVGMASAHPKTWIVDDDGGPGVDFIDIPPAITAAAPGDLILVRDGSYSSFYINKPLALIADTGHQPTVTEGGTVTSLDPGEFVVVSGFDVYRIYAHDSDGNIIVDGCTSLTSHMWPPVLIEDCSQITLSRCLMEKTGALITVPAVQVENATVILSECSFTGQDGMEGYESEPGYDGGAGLDAEDSALYFQSSAAHGGTGGDYYDSSGYMVGPGNGGSGVKLRNSVLHLFGTENHVLNGGAGGYTNYGASGKPGYGVDARYSEVAYSGVTLTAPAFYNYSSSINEVSPDVPVVLLNGSGQLNDSIEPVIYGPTNSQYIIFYSPVSQVNQVGQMYTHLHLGIPYMYYLVAGTIPPGNPPSHPIHIPHDTALQGHSLFLQAYVKTPFAKSYISTSAGFVIR